MPTNRQTLNRSTALRTALLTGLLLAAPMALAACSPGSTAAPASSSTAVSTTVVTSTSVAVVTTTDVATDTAKITELTARVTPTPTTGPAGGGGGGTTATTTDGGGGDNHSSTTPYPCPDSDILGAVTPDYDPQYPINAVTCGGEWPVGTYDADGKNQTTGIWRHTGGGWALQDRTDVSATADNVPQELYAQACENN